VDTGLPFAKANEEFRAWIGNPEQVTFASWGKYDDTQYRQDCEYHKVPFPFTGDHFNVKDHYGKKMGIRSRGQLRAVRALGLEWDGPRHRALPDARMAAKVLAKVGL
jgi:inhibitor of KinA sporulation pathway (predicted exonuclease)